MLKHSTHLIFTIKLSIILNQITSKYNLNFSSISLVISLILSIYLFNIQIIITFNSKKQNVFIETLIFLNDLYKQYLHKFLINSLSIATIIIQHSYNLLYVFVY